MAYVNFASPPSPTPVLLLGSPQLSLFESGTPGALKHQWPVMMLGADSLATLILFPSMVV